MANWKTLLFFLLVLTNAVLAQPMVYPDPPFQGLQLKLSVSGARLDPPTDSRGSELTERRYTGTWSSGLKVEGSATAGELSQGDCTVQVNLFVDAKKEGLGSFAGTIQGSTARFTLSGHWSNGRAATIMLERVP